MATVGTVFKSTNPSGKTVWKIELIVGKRPDGWHAEVTLSSLWPPPLVSEFFPEELRLRFNARAQTFLR